MKGQGAGNAEVRVWGRIPRYQDGSMPTLNSQINVLYDHWRRQVQRARTTFQKSTLTLLLPAFIYLQEVYRRHCPRDVILEMQWGDISMS